MDEEIGLYVKKGYWVTICKGSRVHLTTNSIDMSLQLDRDLVINEDFFIGDAIPDGEI